MRLRSFCLLNERGDRRCRKGSRRRAHERSVLNGSGQLMIAIDDMRPELSIYGYDHMHTPNMQRLASRSVVFDRAYVQVRHRVGV